MNLLYKFPQIQLPKFYNLIKVLFTTSTSNNLSSFWCNQEDYFQWFSRSAWAIYYIILIKKKISNKEKIIIWLPDYFCNETLNYARTIEGVSFYFYRINVDMSPNYDDLFKHDEKNKPDIFLFVQYFGNHFEAKKVFEFCKLNQIWIIEDAAHVLIPNNHIGEYGDFVLYSPHKLLPIPDGSIMVLKKTGPSCLLDNSIFPKLLEEYLNKSIEKKFFNKNTMLWYPKKILQIFGFKNFIKIPDFEITLQSCKPDKFHINFSNISKKILNYEITNLNKIIEIRSKNYTTWAIILNKIITHVKYEIIKNNAIAYLIALKFNNKEDCITIYKFLINSGIPVTHWPDLPNEVINNQHYHTNAIQLRNTCLYLPLHMNVNFVKLESLKF
jgi:hypothetical protein